MSSIDEAIEIVHIHRLRLECMGRIQPVATIVDGQINRTAVATHPLVRDRHEPNHRALAALGPVHHEDR
jgi:hypothetical protein